MVLSVSLRMRTLNCGLEVTTLRFGTLSGCKEGKHEPLVSQHIMVGCYRMLQVIMSLESLSAASLNIVFVDSGAACVKV